MEQKTKNSINKIVKIILLFIVAFAMATLLVLLLYSPKTYQVSFDADNGEAIKVVDIIQGKSCTEPFEPSKDGFYFVGWYNGQEKWEFDSPIKQDICLKAKWSMYDENNNLIVHNLDRLKMVKEDTNAILTNNIDIKNQEWTPIGTEQQPYTGTFDGNNFFIFNFKITQTSTNVGFFGYAQGATIKNIVIQQSLLSFVFEDATPDHVNIGIVAGKIKDCVLNNIKISLSEVVGTGVVDNTSNWGGAVGLADNSRLEKIVVDANVGSGAPQYAGCINLAGIVAESNNNTVISECCAAGVITAEFDYCHYVGGIACQLSQSKIENCYSTAEIKSLNGVYGSIGAGGLVYKASNSEIINSYSAGSITGTPVDNHSASFAGICCVADNSSIINCFRTRGITLELRSYDIEHGREQSVGHVVVKNISSNIENSYYDAVLPVYVDGVWTNNVSSVHINKEGTDSTTENILAVMKQIWSSDIWVFAGENDLPTFKFN